MKSSSVHILSQKNTILNQFIAEIRDAEIQKDPMRFRTNLERIGEVFAYEISRELPYQEKEVVTSLGIAGVSVPQTIPVLADNPSCRTSFSSGISALLRPF